MYEYAAFHMVQEPPNVPAGSEARAISSIEAMRSDASTSLRACAGRMLFFPLDIINVPRSSLPGQIRNMCGVGPQRV